MIATSEYNSRYSYIPGYFSNKQVYTLRYPYTYANEYTEL
jgi:hypothetical protein